ncbi:MAG: SapC family protein [Fuerstiella sp.]|nr:SapC family protein [Fuerstiella sp.]
MTTQMLFYDNISVVSQEQHRDLALKPMGDYGFTRNVNSVPLLTSEFLSAAGEFPIVFAGNEDNILPHAIIGTRQQENLFVNEDGEWQGKYVPAFIRRYPFVFSSADDGQTLTLCIDESYPGFNREGQGERLFDADGNQTMYLKNVLEFLRSYQLSFQATTEFCKQILDLGLLTEMQANVTLGTGETNRLTGFRGVDRNRLRQLEDQSVLEMHKSGGLDLIHAQLLSIQNFRIIADRVQPSLSQEAATEYSGEATTPSSE